MGKKEKFKNEHKTQIKDKKHLEHYYAASAGYKELKDNNISVFDADSRPEFNTFEEVAY